MRDSIPVPAAVSRPFRRGPYPVPAPPPVSPQNRAEVFYLQKQIQTQTPMIVVLEDGERLEGCIEWYDTTCLKLRGRNKTLIYKSAIKYMYKASEAGLKELGAGKRE